MRRPWRLIPVLALLMAACTAAPAPSPSPTPAPVALCVPNDPRACTTVGGVPLGRYDGPVSLDTPPCANCRDPLGTARAALEQRSQARVAAIDLFEPDPRVFCPPGCAGATFEPAIYVFTLSDGTAVPIIVYCLVDAACVTVDRY